MKKNKGFTLLELLVVIAIIGILSTIVMVSLSGARQRAQDASIQSYINQIRAQAELHHISEGSYAGLTDPGEPTADLISNIEALNSTVVPYIGPTDVNNKYCVEASSVAGDNYFCVDSTGNITSDDERCSATTFECVTPTP